MSEGSSAASWPGGSPNLTGGAIFQKGSSSPLSSGSGFGSAARRLGVKARRPSASATPGAGCPCSGDEVPKPFLGGHNEPLLRHWFS
jgi:hypothetical protein